MNSAYKVIIKILFLIYCLILLYVLFFYRMGADIGCTYLEWITNMVRPVPFWSLYDFFTTPIITVEYTLSFIKNIMGNFVLFMPMGFFIPNIWKKTKSFGHYIVLILIMVLLIETAQLFTTLGMFDADDIILNVSGAAVGFFISKKAETAIQKRHKRNG